MTQCNETRALDSRGVKTVERVFGSVRTEVAAKVALASISCL